MLREKNEKQQKIKQQGEKKTQPTKKSQDINKTNTMEPTQNTTGRLETKDSRLLLESNQHKTKETFEEFADCSEKSGRIKLIKPDP